MQAHIVTFSANRVGRDFAVGDIHGCFSALQKVLDAVKFEPAVDRLFSVGDLVDRGPESHLVLEWLDKPWFHAICGNHDQMAWRSALGDPYPHVDHRRHGGEWLDALTPDTKEVMGRKRSMNDRLERRSRIRQAWPISTQMEKRLCKHNRFHGNNTLRRPGARDSPWVRMPRSMTLQPQPCTAGNKNCA